VETKKLGTVHCFIVLLFNDTLWK